MTSATDVARRPVDAASLAAFRVLFGLMMFAGTLRFIASGWVDKQYVEPSFFFKYFGFEWVAVWPRTWLYVHFGALAALALMIALGLFYRASCALFFAGFAYVQLMDVTNYLNHYYLIVLLSGLMIFLPLGRTWSLDALLRPEIAREEAPAWVLHLLRFQIALVYFNAALAKTGGDWLLEGQPLAIWMAARSETPLIGPLLDEPWTGLVMSWAGFLYDLTIVGFLSMRRTRLFAYLTVLAFHFLTRVFFDIGMFPFIMVVSTTLFFSPEWPRKLLRSLPAFKKEATPFPPPPKWAVVALAAYCLLQVVFPLRHRLYEGDVLWHEQGMRWSWKVMVREKNGSVTFRVKEPDTGREWQVSPREYLTWRQSNEMSAQPDLILQLAHHVADDFRARGLADVEVRADALASLNGRAPERLIDPEIDLARVTDGIGPAAWIRRVP